jgi:hypothetical protein
LASTSTSKSAFFAFFVRSLSRASSSFFFPVGPAANNRTTPAKNSPRSTLHLLPDNANTPTLSTPQNNTNDRTYADAAGAETAAKFQTPLFLAASASAEFFADMALAPFEAVKVAVQTRPGFAKGLFDGMPKLVAADGVGT